MLDVKKLCLGVLTQGDMTGYEIKKLFEEGFAHFFVAGYGSIYPALQDLTREALVTCRDVEQEGRPDKKVYRLTHAGREALVDALNRTSPRHKVRSEFLVLMYFASLLTPERLGQVLDQRERDIEALLERIAEAEACPTLDPGQTMVAGLGRVTLQAQLNYLRDHRDLLENDEETALAAAGD